MQLRSFIFDNYFFNISQKQREKEEEKKRKEEAALRYHLDSAFIACSDLMWFEFQLQWECNIVKLFCRSYNSLMESTKMMSNKVL